MPMSKDKIKKIHLIYGCVAAVLIVVLGIALILSCLDIYNSGPRPYSPESIGQRFQQIALLAYGCIALVLGGIVLGLALPAEAQKPTAARDAVMAMNKLKSKTGTMDAADAEAVKNEQLLRPILRIGTAAGFAGLMVYPAIYFMDSSHFTITALNDDIRNAVCIALIPACIGLMLCFLCSVLENKSISRETDIYKKVIASGNVTAASITESKKSKTLIIVRCSLLVLAVCLMIAGILNGGMKDVLDKAVAICTECIGLG